uniref:Uncharacterized protein n=1 Tax=Oryza sativa subsp. japonica TaxID=39947 RepID=Q6Z332_ORYSJ|nr:hypothetical protein [Oryza sativa Japonica Group]
MKHWARAPELQPTRSSVAVQSRQAPRPKAHALARPVDLASNGVGADLRGGGELSSRRRSSPCSPRPAEGEREKEREKGGRGEEEERERMTCGAHMSVGSTFF